MHPLDDSVEARTFSASSSQRLPIGRVDWCFRELIDAKISLCVSRVAYDLRSLSFLVQHAERFAPDAYPRAGAYSRKGISGLR